VTGATRSHLMRHLLHANVSLLVLCPSAKAICESPTSGNLAKHTGHDGPAQAIRSNWSGSVMWATIISESNVHTKELGKFVGQVDAKKATID
jgi:hypothetical protein